MKKSYYLLTLILFIISFSAHADLAEGRLDCKITGSTVESSEDGKYKSYSSIEGEAKAGDSSILEYSVREDSVYVSMKLNNKKEDVILNVYFKIRKIDSEVNIHRDKDLGIVLTKNGNGYYESLSLLPDYIRLKRFSELSLIRYYKNDWHGMFVFYVPSKVYVQVLTFNCRHTNDQLDKAYKIFKGYAKDER